MPVVSMTGYGYEITKDGYMVEIRSLNGRYLDIAMKIPQEFYPFENDFRNIIRSHFFRGNVELLITHRNIKSDILIPKLNKIYAQHYIDILKELSEISGFEPDYSNLLQIKDIVYIEVDENLLKDALKDVLRAIDNVCLSVEKMRINEGKLIFNALSENLNNLKAVVGEIASLSDRHRESIRVNLKAKISELLSDISVDEHRFEEEVLYFLNRTDISEETERLMSHIEQFESLISSERQIGRRCDFLCQEMVRELNTISSKATMIEIKRDVIKGKDIVERLREQVQNIE